jgi:hypothetical protein
MRRARAFALFWWDFIVGDDYRIAVGVIVSLGAAAGLARAGVPAWWVVPLGVLAILGESVVNAGRRARREDAGRLD